MRRSVQQYMVVMLTASLLGCSPKQRIIESTNRIILHQNDTLYEFYAQKLEKHDLEKMTDVSKMYYWYNGTSISVTQSAAHSRILHGKYIAYYPDHNFMESGNFYKGLKNGEWKRWYPGGILQNLRTWEKGHLEGIFENYDSSGHIVQKAFYDKGRLSGEQLFFNADTVVQKEQYKDGMLIVGKDSSAVNSANKQ